MSAGCKGKATSALEGELREKLPCLERRSMVGSFPKAWICSFWIDFIITKTKFGVSQSYDYTPCFLLPLS